MTNQEGKTGVSLEGRNLALSYDAFEVTSDLSVSIPTSRITVIVGANACGKSTLLRALARLLKPKAGAVYLDGKSIHHLPTKQVALRLGLLPQSPIAPEGLTVSGLVARGRYPHQSWLRQWSQDDEKAVAEAMAATGILDLASRDVDELSGGQRQRVWIAMAIAQETEILLLDEPTTFLDLTHQLDVLDLLVDLNRERGRTIVIVLHDLNHACRYADHLIAMKNGEIVAEGPPSEVVTVSLTKDVFNLDAQIMLDPIYDTPMVIPIGRHRGSVLLPASSQESPNGPVSNAGLAAFKRPPISNPSDSTSHG